MADDPTAIRETWLQSDQSSISKGIQHLRRTGKRKRRSGSTVNKGRDQRSSEE